MDRKKQKETIIAYLWSAPSLILILLIVIFPILYTAYISLTNMNVYHWNNYELIGLKNYKEALLVSDCFMDDCKYAVTAGHCISYGKPLKYQTFKIKKHL